MASSTTDAMHVAHKATSAELRTTDIGVTAMAVVFVVLRFLSRWQRHARFGADDYLIAVSLVLLFSNLALNLIMIENGLGVQAKELEISQLMMISKVLFADEPLYVINLALIKIAILVMYYRIFALRSFKIAAYVISSITICWSLTFIVICIFQCSPISRAWNPNIAGRCLNLRAIFIGNAVPNILTDFIILTMPTYHVWKLRIKLVQRITISMMFLLGFFVIFASAYRLTTLLQMNQNNLSWTITTPTTWSHIEMSAAIVSACLPTLRPLVHLFLQKTGLGSKNDKSQNDPSAWNPVVVTIGGSGEDRKKRPARFYEIDETETWTEPSDGKGSSDEVPLKAIRMQVHVEQKQSSEE